MKLYMFLLAILLSSQACTKDQDPEVSIETPNNHQQLLKGSTFNVKATFTDDKGLKSYLIHVGDASGNQVSEFDFHEATDISGKSFTYNKLVSVSSSIGDVYYLYIEVVDDADQKTQEQLILYFK